MEYERYGKIGALYRVGICLWEKILFQNRIFEMDSWEKGRCEVGKEWSGRLKRVPNVHLSYEKLVKVLN